MDEDLSVTKNNYSKLVLEYARLSLKQEFVLRLLYEEYYPTFFISNYKSFRKHIVKI